MVPDKINNMPDFMTNETASGSIIPSHPATAFSTLILSLRDNSILNTTGQKLSSAGSLAPAL
jgi:hypothetical protein